MKRTIAILLTVCMLVLLAACNTSAPAKTSAPAASSSAPAASSAPAPAKSDYPNRQITLIVGYEPGGMSDVGCRMFAKYMTPILKQSVVIENLPGAGNMVALNALLSRKADGYTITMCAAADSPWAYEVTKAKDIQWKASDFEIIARVNHGPAGMGIIADKKKGWKTLPEFVNAVKAKPPKTFNYGILGPGRLDEPQLKELEKAWGVQFNVALYGSSAAVQTDIMTGDLDAGTIGCNRDDFKNNNHATFVVLGLYGNKAMMPKELDKGLPMVGDYEKELNFKFNDFKYVPLENGLTALLANAKMDKGQIKVLRDCLQIMDKDPNFAVDNAKIGGVPGYMDHAAMAPFWAGIQDALRASMGPSDAKIVPPKTTTAAASTAAPKTTAPATSTAAAK